MPDYNNNPKDKKEIIEKLVEREFSIDLNLLSQHISKALEVKFEKLEDKLSKQGSNYVFNENKEKDDGFDSTKTMDKLAEQMLVERGDNQANFKDLGNIKTTKRDNKELDNTIDLLSGLDD
jgi:hypothetical protein